VEVLCPGVSTTGNGSNVDREGHVRSGGIRGGIESSVARLDWHWAAPRERERRSEWKGEEVIGIYTESE